LIDIESGTVVDATITALAAQHARDKAQAFVDRIGAAARTQGVHHRLLTSDMDLTQVLVQTLRRDGLLA
jgi:hypothetical protein